MLHKKEPLSFKAHLACQADTFSLLFTDGQASQGRDSTIGVLIFLNANKGEVVLLYNDLYGREMLLAFEMLLPEWLCSL